MRRVIAVRSRATCRESCRRLIPLELIQSIDQRAAHHLELTIHSTFRQVQCTLWQLLTLRSHINGTLVLL